MTTPEDPLIIRSKKRRRTVALHVEADGRLTVQAPMNTSRKWIDAFIASREAWIARRRLELTKREEKKILLFTDGMKIPLGDQTYTLKVHEGGYASPRLEEEILHLYLEGPLSDTRQQEEIKTELKLWYKKQARTLIRARLDLWAERMKLTPRRLFLNEPKNQWGSCTAENDIRMNWHLVLAPLDLLDYVLVHELSHIKHKHHQPAFWHRVERTLPDYKARRKALREWKGEDFFSA